MTQALAIPDQLAALIPEIPAESVAEQASTAISHVLQGILATKATDEATAQALVSFGHKAKQLLDYLEQQHRPTSKRLRQMANDIDKPWREAEKLAEQAIKHCRTEPVRYRAAIEAETRRALAAAAASGAGATEIAAATQAVVAPPPKGLTVTTQKRWRVTGMVPREYWTRQGFGEQLDHAKVNTEIKAGNPPAFIEQYVEKGGQLR